MSLNVSHTRELLQNFDFARLFIEELGWSNPPSRQPVTRQLSTKSHQLTYNLIPIAQLAGVMILEAKCGDGIPDAKTRAAIQKQVSEQHIENLLIFVDSARSQSLWYWVKREDNKTHPRDHLYVKGQPGDLFLGKLASMVVDISELDAEGNIPVLEVANRLKAALDVERVTKKFYAEFDTERLSFLEHIHGIDDEHQLRWYASVLMNRLMFIYFLQKKLFLDGGNEHYLEDKLAQSRKRRPDTYYSVFLKALFFEGFAKPEPARSVETKILLGRIRYLNGGLFLPHCVELNHGFPAKPRIKIPDVAFENILRLFGRYSWNLNDTPAGKDDEINPDVLGYIFEKYINQKQFGAYYTRPEITGYLSERTVFKLVLDRLDSRLATRGLPESRRRFATISDLLLNLDATLCNALLFEVLPSLRLLDPACGSAAFLVAAMKVLINIYSAVIGKIQFLNNVELTDWFKTVQAEHPSPLYYIKKRIITDNLFGVDMMDEATEIAKLRLFLALVASAQSEDQLEPLPNIDFNILTGNSLIGLLHVDPARFDAGQAKNGSAQDRLTLQHSADLGFTFETKAAPTQKEKAAAFVAQQNAARFAAILQDKNKSIELYRKHAFQPGEKDGLTQEERLISLRSHIEKIREESYNRLNQMLLDEFRALGIEFQEATWDDRANDVGRPHKRQLKKSDIDILNPFHWGYEFDKVMADGGFDGIVTNPPWEIFKPNSKEFFEAHSELVSKKNMSIHDFEKEQARLLRDPEIRAAWLEYLSSYPHLSAYYRSAAQFKNQISIVNGKKAGSDINLYKLFLEQCHNLLRAGGRCGIVIPSGVYTDLGTKQLREMLFLESQTETIFGLSNERFIFEEVHHAFKFCLLCFGKGGNTVRFSAAFRINPREAISSDRLESFLHSPNEHLTLPVDLIRRLSPDSLSVMEFRIPLDATIAEKMLKFPLLGEEISDKWNLKLTAEFHMTNDSDLFKTSGGTSRLPLFEGKMIWQFEHKLAEPRFWIEEKAGRKRVLGRESDRGQALDYQTYRLGFRDIAANTNERTLVSTVIPPAFHGNKLPTVRVWEEGKRLIDAPTQLFNCALWNSFVLDWMIRQKVTTTLNFFYIYQLPVPRLTPADTEFAPIVKRAAQLICTAPEFGTLAQEVSTALNLTDTVLKAVKDAAGRAQLRAELDALVAHLYGLSEEEFAHILSTFPLVSEPVKLAAQNAYRDVSLGLIKLKTPV
jgi:hypothetical protein